MLGPMWDRRASLNFCEYVVRHRQGKLAWDPATLWHAMGRENAAARSISIIDCADFSIAKDVDADAFIQG